MSETNREFGSDIGNIMTASQNSQDTSVVDRDLEEYLKTPAANDRRSMEKSSNGTSNKLYSILPSVLAVEVFSLIQNNNSDQDDLLDEIEDLLDETFFVGEKVYQNTKEHTIKSKEKRGGLVQYTMENGQKINQRDLKRNKELNMEYFKNLLLESATFDGKTWKLNDDVRKMYKLKDKLAPIFCMVKPKAVKKSDDGDGSAAAGGSSSAGSNSNSEDEKKERSQSPEIVFQARASGGMPAVANRKVLAEKQKKEKERKKQQEAKELKEKEKAEKKKKVEEEKAKVKEEKKKQADEKKAETEKAKQQTKGIDKFLKKKEGDDDAHTPSMFSPLRFSEKRLNIGLKKLEEAWVKRDLEQFNEACTWCEKQLSGVQNRSIENPIWNFSIQKLVDKNKDKIALKSLRGEKRQAYKQEMLESRKELYKNMEPKIKDHFSEEDNEEDLLLAREKLEIPGSFTEDHSKESLICMEITQFFVSMRKILLFDQDITAKRLLASLKKGKEDFSGYSLKLYQCLIETFLQEEGYDKIAHANARLHEFAITEWTVTEIVRCFFLGKTEVCKKNEYKKTAEQALEPEEEEEAEEDKKIAEPENENDEPMDFKEQQDQKPEDLKVVGKIQAVDRTRFLAFFDDGKHMNEWEMNKHLELLQYLINLAIHLPLIREWYVKHVTHPEITTLRENITENAKEIEELNKQIAELPVVDDINNLSRAESRARGEMDKKREKLEYKLEVLKIERDTMNIEAAAKRDDIARAKGAILLGEDRHLRKYYWFANSSDAGVWIQDFGTTPYENWVRKCETQGIRRMEEADPETLPDFDNEPIDESAERWIRITNEDCLRNLEKSLKKNGKREKCLRRNIRMNMEMIIKSFRRAPENASPEPEFTYAADDAENVFDGPFGSLKTVLHNLVTDLATNMLVKLDVEAFKSKLAQADGLDKIKSLLIELVESIPAVSIVSRIRMKIALTTKEFSVLIVPRFVNRINEAVSSSGLHLLISYLESRIDWNNTIAEKPCTTCRKKKDVERKLQCQNCSNVYHNNCVRPSISLDKIEEPGFRENWICIRCHNEEKRMKREEHSRQASEEPDANNSSDDDSDSENEEYGAGRSRKAKRKATEAMRDVIEHFENPAKRTPNPPKVVVKPIKKKKRVPVKVQELYDSIENHAPRFYKVLQNVPTPRPTRGEKSVRDLQTIEENLDDYRDPEHLRVELSNFFTYVRNYFETHNSRKLEELDELVSALEF